MTCLPFTSTSLFRILPLICCIGQATAASVVPSWAGEAGTTHHVYTFSSNTATPAADTAQSAFASPTLTVLPDAGGSGWQDPNEEFTSPGVNSDGAWDLASSGSISISLPVAAAAAAVGTTYRIDFVIYVVGLVTPNELPSLSTVGLSPQDLAITDANVQPPMPLSRWDSRTWTGYYEGVSSSAITLQLLAPELSGSTVDTFEVYTRVTVVPEPSISMLALAAGLAGCLRRRRR